MIPLALVPVSKLVVTFSPLGLVLGMVVNLLQRVCLQGLDNFVWGERGALLVELVRVDLDPKVELLVTSGV